MINSHGRTFVNFNPQYIILTSYAISREYRYISRDSRYISREPYYIHPFLLPDDAAAIEQDVVITVKRHIYHPWYYLSAIQDIISLIYQLNSCAGGYTFRLKYLCFTGSEPNGFRLVIVQAF